jgi:hypothetical protein
MPDASTLRNLRTFILCTIALAMAIERGYFK